MRRKTIGLFYFLILVGLPGYVFAQNQPLYEQYHFNQLVINPAYAGSKNAFETNFFVHRHSVNFTGAPSTESFTAHLPVANDKVGLGVKFYHDKIGVTNASSFALDYAYRIHLNSNIVAAIGLEASVSTFSIDYTELDAFNDGDPAFDGKVDSYIKPNFGAGIYLHSDKFYFGFSSPTLLANSDGSTTANDSTYDDAFDNTANIYGSAGALIKVTDNFAFKPDMLFKKGENIPSQLDININLIFNNAFLIGTGYRTNSSFNFVAQYMFTSDNILQKHEAGLGYSYNTTFGNDAAFLSPSHEVFLVYRFHKNNTNIKNPRFF